MDLVITLLILALVVVIAMFIVDRIKLPADIGWIVKLIIGVIALIWLLDIMLGGGHFPRLSLR